jgi:RNA polymerase sigma-70 factor (ECF subfamily)
LIGGPFGAGDAEDVVQEAFVKAYAALGRFRADAAFRPWILRIVANEARNARRSGGRRFGLALRAGHQAWTGPVVDTPEQHVVTEETRASVLDLVGSLPERERQVVACRYLLDLTEAETAEVIGVPVGTVKSRHSRGLARLRAAAEATGLTALEEGAGRA